MRIIIKLLLFFIVTSVLCLSCSRTYDRQFVDMTRKLAQEHPWLSFQVQIERTIDTNEYYETWYASYDYRNEVFYLIRDDSVKIWKTTNSILSFVDLSSRELAEFVREETNNTYPLLRNNLECKLGHLPAFFQRPMNELQPLEPINIYTSSAGEKYRDYIGRDCPKISEDVMNGEKWETQHECHFYVSKNSVIIDSLVEQKISDVPFSEKTVYRIGVVDYFDKSDFFDSIFDFQGDEYRGFSNHNNSFLPYSMRKSDETTITDRLLEFPIVSLSQDTTCLAEIEGWILLNLWTLNCPTCINELSEWGVEKDSLGSRILSKEGVSVLSVNYTSDNMDMIRQVAEKTNSLDIAYSAKGLGTMIRIPYIGYNYLISPSKELVYECGYVGHNSDYSQIIQAIAEFEKKELEKTPIISFETVVYNFDTIPLYGKVEHVFDFTNIGNAPLLVSSAFSSCGCVVPEWTKHPIAPQGGGCVKVIYNANKVGPFTKAVVVKSNDTCSSKTVLRIKGFVSDSIARDL